MALIVIETPRFSFTKYRYDRASGKLVPEFFSPFPCPVNYGFIKGTKAADGDPVDAVIVRGSFRPGQEVEAEFSGVVKFRDSGKRDYKYVVSDKSASDRLVLWLAFRAYAVFKLFRNIILKRRFDKPEFLGVEWFEEKRDLRG